jgi:hypothetical protein
MKYKFNYQATRGCMIMDMNGKSLTSIVKVRETKLFYVDTNNEKYRKKNFNLSLHGNDFFLKDIIKISE